jgi:nucleotide-binding universal stress UspA family protein
MNTRTHHAPAPPPPVFDSILCVTDDSGAAAEAVRQAAWLAGSGAEVELLAIAPDPKPGAPRPQAMQIQALVAGIAETSQLGVHAEVHIAASADPAQTVLDRASSHGLLVLPPGPLATAVVPRSPVPVLVARPAPTGARLGASVLIAVDGTPHASAAAQLGARIAAREGEVPALVATPEHDATHQHTLQSDVETVERLAGGRPLILDEYGPPASSIAAAAASLDATLIVLGGRRGQPVPSVSAAVAGQAPCSVLVLRPDPAVSS